MTRAPEMRAWTDEEIVVDNFAGGGGASTGLAEALGRSPDIAINHDPEAIALHTANHPETKHYCEDVWHVDPLEAAGGRRVRLGWFSPDCKDFSKAKGGKPISKNIRGLAVVVLRWAGKLRAAGSSMDVVMLENVEEFLQWGPLLPNGKRDPARKGETFRALVDALSTGLPADHPAMSEFREFLGPDFPYELLVEGLGYDVQWRELRGCDYGAPTTRKRLFLIARCDGRPIAWPAATHGPGRAHPYRTAAECIDFSIACPSIFDREAQGKKPLVEKTLARIARGLRRFVVEAPEPFLVSYYGTKEPGAERGASLRAPMPTVTTENRFGLVAPVLVPRYGERPGQTPRALSVELPMPTIVPTGNGASLVAAFLAKHYGGNETPGSALPAPIDTITTQDHHAVVASYLVKYKGTCLDGQPLSEPLSTVQASGTHHAQVAAFLVAYFGNEKDGGSLNEPLRTVSTKDRFALVTIAGTEYVIVDIGMRMLTARELFNGQGFPPTYLLDIRYRDPKTGRMKLLSPTAQKRMCGNAVNKDVANALVRANLPRRDAKDQERAA